jgi:integrase
MKAYLEIEAEQLENATTCMVDKLLIRLLIRLGCRISEAVSLEVKDKDYARCLLLTKTPKPPLRSACYKLLLVLLADNLSYIAA